MTATGTARTANADALIMQVGRAVLADASYQGADWSALTLVATFDQGRKSLFGYTYMAGGAWKAVTPSDARRVINLLRDLREAMREADGKAPWRQCRVQIKRADMKINLAFEYDDPQRWMVTPANMADMVEALRPE
jgi:hypothetical protein